MKGKKGSILYCADQISKGISKRRKIKSPPKPRPKVRSSSYNSDDYRLELKRRIRGD